MKKTISILILACSTLVGFSQSLLVNGDATATRSTGVTTIKAETTDPNSFSLVTAKSNSSSVSFVAFGSNGGVGTLYDSQTAGVGGNANTLFFINEKATGNIVFATGGYGQTKECLRIETTGVSICAGGPTYPITTTAHLTIGAGGTSPGKAPLKILSGNLLTTPEPNALEYDGTDLWFTNSAGVRKKVTLQ